jgi:hypothetical protein
MAKTGAPRIPVTTDAVLSSMGYARVILQITRFRRRKIMGRFLCTVRSSLG